MRCEKHGLVLAPDGLCIVCRRDLGDAPSRSATPPARSSAPAMVLGAIVVAAGLGAFAIARATPKVAAADVRPPAVDGEGAARGAADGPSAPRVTVYSTSWCGYCKRTKRWLQERGVAYDEVDVERDAEGARRYRQVAGGGAGVPVVQIDDHVIRGFDPRAMERALAAK